MNNNILRVVIDTNVIISALYIARGNAWQIITWAIEGNIQNIVSGFILEEVQRVLEKKFLWHPSKIKDAIIQIESFSEKISPEKRITVIPYLPDNRILECAVDGQADFIISGDHHLTDLKEFQGIMIMNPATFLSIIRGEGLPE
ncbi:putative toxin-antitoxin system toxin component, PIN family [Candidatus Latescibacterota bacterium]